MGRGSDSGSHMDLGGLDAKDEEGAWAEELKDPDFKATRRINVTVNNTNELQAFSLLYLQIITFI